MSCFVSKIPKSTSMINNLVDHSLFAWLTWILTKKDEIDDKASWLQEWEMTGHMKIASFLVERDLHVPVSVVETMMFPPTPRLRCGFKWSYALFLWRKDVCEIQRRCVILSLSRVSCFLGSFFFQSNSGYSECKRVYGLPVMSDSQDDDVTSRLWDNRKYGKVKVRTSSWFIRNENDWITIVSFWEVCAFCLKTCSLPAWVLREKS